MRQPQGLTRRALTAQGLTRQGSNRQGFTLVEMLVAMALTLFIMVILSQAFIAALDTFRGLKAIGDMDEGLRTTVNSLRADLLLDHLTDATGKPIRLKSLAVPTEGFFRVQQGVSGAAEATDWERISSYPNAAMLSRREATHILHFSVYAKDIYLAGGTTVVNRPENFFVAAVKPKALGASRLLDNAIDFVYPTGGVTPHRNGDTVSSLWAEVAYAIDPVQQGTTDLPNGGASGTGTPLYRLCRWQYLVPADNANLNNGTKEPFADRAKYYKSVSCQAGGPEGRQAALCEYRHGRPHDPAQ